ncbi:helix-turn-helix domain-containing protein [Microbulbifer sp. HZ11]|uniref:helix-turn-helix domain-containing protein n=1 Tax=Microbulbifer sp. HZ11 TaxID=1453501 RepID=UPI0018CC1E59|nr:helix-turn-helix transcriptional regulator [Microbulbifer sp. HZ11]
MLELKDRLKAARVAAKKTQREVVAEVGITQPALSDLERGKSYSSRHLIQLAQYLEVSPTWLATGKGAMFEDGPADNRIRNIDTLLTQVGPEKLADAASGIIDFERLLDGTAIISARVARKLESRLQLETGWLEVDHSQPGTSEPRTQYGARQDHTLPEEVQELINVIRERARNGSLTAEHANVLRSSLELMTGQK